MMMAVVQTILDKVKENHALSHGQTNLDILTRIVIMFSDYILCMEGHIPRQ